jgi:hypothetical protein
MRPVIGSDQWRGNWQVLCRPGAVCLRPGPRIGTRRAAVGEALALPMGTPVVLLARAPGAAGRCRRFAARAGIELEREYLAFPSAARPGFLVEDAPAATRFFLETLPPPPRPLVGPVVEAAIGAIRLLGPWRLLRGLSPGRVAVGRRV